MGGKKGDLCLIYHPNFSFSGGAKKHWEMPSFHRKLLYVQKDPCSPINAIALTISYHGSQSPINGGNLSIKDGESQDSPGLLEPHTHLSATSSPASSSGKMLKLLSPSGCWATRALSSSKVWGGKRGQGDGEGKRDREMGSGKRDREMLLGAAKEGLDFSLQGLSWVWGLILPPRAVQARAESRSRHRGATLQCIKATPTVLVSFQRSGQGHAPAKMLQDWGKSLPGLKTSPAQLQPWSQQCRAGGPHPRLPQGHARMVLVALMETFPCTRTAPPAPRGCPGQSRGSSGKPWSSPGADKAPALSSLRQGPALIKEPLIRALTVIKAL